MAAMIAIRVLASLALTLGGVYLCRRRSAALRHFVLASGVVAALLSLPLGALLPVWTVAVPASSLAQVESASVAPAGRAVDVGARVAGPSPAAVAEAPAPPARSVWRRLAESFQRLE